MAFDCGVHELVLAFQGSGNGTFGLQRQLVWIRRQGCHDDVVLTATVGPQLLHGLAGSMAGNEPSQLTRKFRRRTPELRQSLK